MPLERSTDFENNAGVSGERLDAIVSVSDGSSTWYFSRRPIPGGLGTIPIYPLLIDHSDIVDAMDWIGKSVMAGDVTVTFSNVLQYPVDGSRPIRISDLLVDAMGGELKIYFIAGEEAAALSDCLLVFSGYMTDAPEYDAETLTLRASSKGKLINKKLPTLTVADKWPDAPADSLTKLLPIVYGIWDKPDLYGLDSDGTGLFRGVIVEDDQMPLYIISDHEMYDVDTVHILFNDVLLSLTFVADAYSGAEGHYVEADITTTHLDFSLSSTLPGIYDAESYLADDPENAHDDDPNTIAALTDNAADASGAMAGKATWAIENDLAFRRYFLTGNAEVKFGYRNLGVGYDVEPANIIFVLIYLNYYHNGGDTTLTIGQVTNYSDLEWDDMDLFYVPSPGGFKTSADLGDNLSEQFTISWLAETESGVGDGTPNNQDILTIGEFILCLEFDIEQSEQFCWSSGSGKMFGSWVDAGGRDNGFDEDDVITDPAMIVEDIFRSYLNLETTDIDTASFDAAINANVDMRVNVFESTDAFSLIQELCEQSTFAVFYSAAGKLTAVPLNDTNPTIAETIQMDQILDYDLKISKTSDIINKLTVRSRYKAHNGEYYDSDLFEDTYSQAQIGERPASYDWKRLVADSVDEVAGVYVADSTGIWSQPHVQVSFTVPGCIMSHLQTGDWISLHADVDDICKAYGSTWDAKKLLVIEARKNTMGTQIKAIELYE